jgi:hypothetical protein
MGLLSLLSPCILPLLPIVLGAAASEHRMGPAALAGGVALSFVAIGLFVATAGFGSKNAKKPGLVGYRSGSRPVLVANRSATAASEPTATV